MRHTFPIASPFPTHPQRPDHTPCSTLQTVRSDYQINVHFSLPFVKRTWIFSLFFSSSSRYSPKIYFPLSLLADQLAPPPEKLRYHAPQDLNITGGRRNLHAFFAHSRSQLTLPELGPYILGLGESGFCSSPSSIFYAGVNEQDYLELRCDSDSSF
ncbi:hypothetical protein BT96DRAFT_988053 [Gymnopus androsaceus JB14]|uniref:Uncharacterized protein n=1 Tax=Gymnopus androsaceus JB14 TaxID=1447944 RepID=A0A6A4I776_9AGAR|nr:hypothetical protein BT96DRAFT_988053 [Gymnopus androsaceus JB14]